MLQRRDDNKITHKTIQLQTTVIHVALYIVLVTTIMI